MPFVATSLPELFGRRKSIEAHDYHETPPTVARHRRSRASVAFPIRRQSNHPRNKWLRQSRHGLSHHDDSADSLVGVFQPRTQNRALWRPRPDRCDARTDVATAARFDVVAMAACVRDSGRQSRLCDLGCRYTQLVGASSADNDGSNDLDCLWGVAITTPERNQRRSQRTIRMALDAER